MVSYDTSQWEYQILDRIQAFGYTANDFANPVEDCESLYQNICEERVLWSDKEVVEFTGDTGLALQDAINENGGKIIAISSDEINVEQTIQMKSDTYLLGDDVDIHADVEGDVFSMKDISNSAISGFRVDGNADNAGFSFGNCYEMESFPSEIILYQNEVSNNQAGGIYCCGVYKSYFINNTVVGNQKEGTCLDWQTFGCFLLKNTYQRNGWRANQTDEILKSDAVLEQGRMFDGSANAKLPGVSLDNAAYNILEQNTVCENGGSGIKSVRAAVDNLITKNIIYDNNSGCNPVYHFFGIELGGEKDIQIGKNMDAPESGELWNMDAGPAIGNIVTNNTVSGSHYAALFLAGGSQDNIIRNNISTGETYWCIESIAEKENVFDANAGEKPNRIL